MFCGSSAGVERLRGGEHRVALRRDGSQCGYVVCLWVKSLFDIQRRGPCFASKGSRT